MVRVKEVTGWAILLASVMLLVGFIGQVKAQESTVLGDGPQALVVVADKTDDNTAVTATTASQNENPLGETLTEKVYLPIIINDLCLYNAQAQAIAELIMNDPEQKRPQMVCDPVLAKVAYEKAFDLGNRNYFSHVDPDGIGPNYLVKQAGYQLPTWYGQEINANNVESLGAGYDSATAVWAGWKSSGGHRTHIFGLDPFWGDQIHYGIGYAYVPGSTYEHYWVFISAP